MKLQWVSDRGAACWTPFLCSYFAESYCANPLPKNLLLLRGPLNKPDLLAPVFWQSPHRGLPRPVNMSVTPSPARC